MNIQKTKNKKLITTSNLYYEEITNEYLLNINKNKKATITNAKETTINGKTYKVNKQNPIIHDFNEMEVARFIQRKLHMDVEYLPNINYEHIGDFKINNKEFWELKSITKSSKNTVKNAIRQASHQSDIILLDITFSDISLEQLLNDINDAFRQRINVKRIIIKKGNNILKVMVKKRN